ELLQLDVAEAKGAQRRAHRGDVGGAGLRLHFQERAPLEVDAEIQAMGEEQDDGDDRERCRDRKRDAAKAREIEMRVVGNDAQRRQQIEHGDHGQHGNQNAQPDENELCQSRFRLLYANLIQLRLIRFVVLFSFGSMIWSENRCPLFAIMLQIGTVFGRFHRTQPATIRLVRVNAVNTVVMMPMPSVTAKPRTGPVPMMNSAAAAMKVVMLESRIVDSARLNPASIAEMAVRPPRSSSRMRS